MGIPQQPAPNVAAANQFQQIIFYVRLKQMLQQVYSNIAQNVSKVPWNWKLATIGTFLFLIMLFVSLLPNNKVPAQSLEPARVIYFEEPEITPPLEASFRAFSWPAADVFVDDEFIGEAPDPTLYSIEAGNHTVEFVTRAGENRKFTQHFEPGEEYIFKINFETDE